MATKINETGTSYINAEVIQPSFPQQDHVAIVVNQKHVLDNETVRLAVFFTPQEWHQFLVESLSELENSGTL